MDARTLFGNFLKAADLPKPARVEIESADVEDVKDKQTGQNARKLVVRFVGKEKGLVCNRTNADSIAQIVGTYDTEAWPGHSLVIYNDPTVRFGNTQGGIRVRPALGSTGATQALPPAPPIPTGDITDDDIPF